MSRGCRNVPTKRLGNLPCLKFWLSRKQNLNRKHFALFGRGRRASASPFLPASAIFQPLSSTDRGGGGGGSSRSKVNRSRSREWYLLPLRPQPRRAGGQRAVQPQVPDGCQLLLQPRVLGEPRAVRRLTTANPPTPPRPLRQSPEGLWARIPARLLSLRLTFF